MRKILLGLVFFVFPAVNVFGQSKEARKIDEFGIIPCGHFNALIYSAYAAIKEAPEAKLHVIYYGEGRAQTGSTLNGKTKRPEKKLFYPHRLDALNRAKEVPLNLRLAHNLAEDKVVLIDGGFREDFELEIWLVPKDSAPPRPTPTVDEKDVKFRKGKPHPPRACARAYDMYDNPKKF